MTPHMKQQHKHTEIEIEICDFHGIIFNTIPLTDLNNKKNSKTGDKTILSIINFKGYL